VEKTLSRVADPSRVADGSTSIAALNDDRWEAMARARLDELTKPRGSLGRLEDIAAKMVRIQRNRVPPSERKTIYVFAADHGVTDEGVSAYPKQVTAEMVGNFLAGGAAINVLARLADAEVVVVDVGVDAVLASDPGLVARKVRRSTRNFAREAAMSEEELQAAIQVGRQLAHEPQFQSSDLVAVGEMGIGNSTSAAALTAALSGKAIAEVTGPGTGISTALLEHKRHVIECALQLHRVASATPMEALRTIGGLEIAAIVGMVLEAAKVSKPIVVDGFIATAAAALAFELESQVRDVLFAGHLSPEPGHRVLLEQMGLPPILDLQMRLGEATGAALAMIVIEAAVRVLNEMATFRSAGVSGPTT
jgi:nicotinate-nucleotide--dimethylbenzimidazole phosphoribosyltransferase